MIIGTIISLQFYSRGKDQCLTYRSVVTTEARTIFYSEYICIECMMSSGITDMHSIFVRSIRATHGSGHYA